MSLLILTLVVNRYLNLVRACPLFKHYTALRQSSSTVLLGSNCCSLYCWHDWMFLLLIQHFHIFSIIDSFYWLKGCLVQGRILFSFGIVWLFMFCDGGQVGWFGWPGVQNRMFFSAGWVTRSNPGKFWFEAFLKQLRTFCFLFPQHPVNKQNLQWKYWGRLKGNMEESSLIS